MFPLVPNTFIGFPSVGLSPANICTVSTLASRFFQLCLYSETFVVAVHPVCPDTIPIQEDENVLMHKNASPLAANKSHRHENR